MNILAAELSRYYEEISPYDFYRSIFGDDELDELDAFTKGKACAIAVEVTDKTYIDAKGRKQKVVNRYTVTDDLDTVVELQSSPHFCIMAPVSYVGKSRKTANAKAMYALCVELDGLRVSKDGKQTGLENLIDRFSDRAHYLPKPTFIVASGTGVHLYYQFEKPLILFPNTIKSLKEYKEQLTKMIWSRSVTYLYKDEDIQQESAFQAFRMPGTCTKSGDKAVAFIVGEPVSIEYMNSFMRKSFKGKKDIQGTYKTDLHLAEAKEKYPEWYEKVVVNGDKTPKPWPLNRAVYDWWLQEIIDGAVDGHRFYCLKMLAIYAIKCGNYHPKKNPNPVTQEEFEADAWALLDDFNARGKRADNPFTEFDVTCALQIYEDRGFVTYPRNSISNRSGIKIVPSVKRRDKGKRLKQDVHLARARAVQKIDYPNGEWRNLDGRPVGSGTKEQLVKDYILEHPDHNVSQIARALGISRPTVYKYLD